TFLQGGVIAASGGFAAIAITIEVRDAQNIADILVDPKTHLSAAIIGRKLAIRCSSARFCMCFTPKLTRLSLASSIFSPTRPARSRRRSMRCWQLLILGLAPAP